MRNLLPIDKPARAKVTVTERGRQIKDADELLKLMYKRGAT